MEKFNSDQLAHQALREIWKMRTTPVVPWIGAGLSAAANLPTWGKLRNDLASRLRRENPQRLTGPQLQFFEEEEDLWTAFDVLINRIGKPAFSGLINQIFETATKCPIPDVYKKLWKLQPRGVVSLNIDPLAQRAANMILGGEHISLVNNRNFKSFGRLFQSEVKFLANLHGVLDEGNSWVFTRTDLAELQSDLAYTHFLGSLFSSNIVVFLGISADDSGAIGHLRTLVGKGIDMGTHFWVTDRNDGPAVELCKELGIQIISYPKQTHLESVKAFLTDLESYIPSDRISPPVVPSTSRKRHVELPEPEEMIGFRSNDIRKLLNQKAVNILKSDSPDREAAYRAFQERYEEVIHRSWYLSKNFPENFFEYILQRKISSDGAFGQVYQAKSSVEGDTKEYAIKLIHDRIRGEDDMLTAFRRGIESMQILTDRGISGVVNLIEAWELPPSLVMDFVPGLNLQEAVETKQIVEISQVLSIARQITEIVLSAHRLPERVLHRDIRPANIILEDFYHNADDINVKVLDFDLSWHRDAVGSSLELRSAPNGYVAPEQTDPARKRLTRNALVDSFGIGMTMYFLCSGKHPVPGIHISPTWERLVNEAASKMPSTTWRSAPSRLARLISRTTMDSQSERPLLDQILRELGVLKRLISEGAYLHQTEYMAEEIACRSEIKGIGTWRLSPTSGELQMTSPTGLTLKLSGGEAGKVLFLVSWVHSGERGYSEIRKYIGPRTEKVAGILKTIGATIIEKSVTFESCRVAAEFAVPTDKQIQKLEEYGKSVSQVFSQLQF